MAPHFAWTLVLTLVAGCTAPLAHGSDERMPEAWDAKSDRDMPSGTEPTATEPTGRALLAGVNELAWRPPGTVGRLQGAEHDARDLGEVATLAGFQVEYLLGPDATREALLSGIADAAATLGAGDTFLLGFSGHGTQVVDENGDESDDLDEALALFDDYLLDDDLVTALSAFVAGVRVLMIVDACHSGTMADCPSSRAAHPTLPIDATILSMSGASDFQLAQDGQRNGVFTSLLLAVLEINDAASPANRKSYFQLFREVNDALYDSFVYRPSFPSPQVASLHACGPEADDFLHAIPFDLRRWNRTDVELRSAHPYAPNRAVEYEVVAPEGTEELRIHFSRISVDYGDRLEVFDVHGNLVADLPTAWAPVRTAPIPGDRATIRLTSDARHESFGFRVTRIYHR